ncbi:MULTISPECIES: hypothetical protein [Leifsonia]|jgi:hypothetical protein|uniref:Uncharacterized protein n=1 Tax=Leifsonia naganoensis TaxID=150025 RepID=A0A853DN12_9MICO|nr:hypothetical protein [Leifsonia naganoensis]NYK09677.1 hypothetical protein [Leifsonia naganoensis]
MSTLMPQLLATWTWRLERVRSGRTILSRSQASTARSDLVNDRAAQPEAYVDYDEEYTAAVDALQVLAQQQNRRDDLLSVLSTERRRREGDDAPIASTDRGRVSLAPEHDRVPSGLPEMLDQWVHRLIRYRNGAKIIDPVEAARAEIRLRNEADLHPGAYRNSTANPYYGRVMRELGEISTSERPGVHLGGRGLHRGIPSDSIR